MLPAGACPAGQVTLPFTGLAGPKGIAVDHSNDVFVADSGNSRVVTVPATGSMPAPPCPLTVSRFKLRAPKKRPASLRFTLVSSHADGIRTVAIRLPFGLLRFAKGAALRHRLKLRTDQARHPSFRAQVSSHRTRLTITLKRAARTLTFKAGHGAIFISHHRGILIYGGASIEVTGASEPAINLSVTTGISPTPGLP
jgi:hypothetical protein